MQSLNSLNFEQPEEAISTLVKASLRMRAQATAQVEALEHANGTAREGIVEVVVAPAGELAAVRFVDDIRDSSAAILSNAAMRAYTRAAELANRATAGAVIDPGASAAVLEAVPEEIEGLRDDDAPVATTPLRAGDPVEDDRLYTVDDLPPDPEFDRILDTLDSDNPMQALRDLESAGAIRLLDTSRPAAELEAGIVAEMEAISSQAQQFGPELRAIRATGENDAARISVNPWGKVLDIVIRPPGMELEREELAVQIMAAARAGQQEASDEVAALLAGTTFADPEDPSVGSVLRKAEHP